MAIPKIWTAANIKMGTIKMNLIGSVLYTTQGYSFVDVNGDDLPELAKNTISTNNEFDSLPDNIKQALTDINTFMYEQALIKEGMEDV